MVGQAGLEPATHSSPEPVHRPWMLLLFLLSYCPIEPRRAGRGYCVEKICNGLPRLPHLGKPRGVPRYHPATVPAFAKQTNPRPYDCSFVCRQQCQDCYEDPRLHKHTSLLPIAIITPCAAGPSTPLRRWAALLPSTLSAPSRSRSGSVA